MENEHTFEWFKTYLKISTLQIKPLYNNKNENTKMKPRMKPIRKNIKIHNYSKNERIEIARILLLLNKN